MWYQTKLSIKSSVSWCLLQWSQGFTWCANFSRHYAFVFRRWEGNDVLGDGRYCSWFSTRFPEVLRLPPPSKTRAVLSAWVQLHAPLHLHPTLSHKVWARSLCTLSVQLDQHGHGVSTRKTELFDLMPHWHSHAEQNIMQLWPDFANTILWTSLLCPLERTEKNKASNACCGTKLELNISFFQLHWNNINPEQKAVFTLAFIFI